MPNGPCAADGTTLLSLNIYNFFGCCRWRHHSGATHAPRRSPSDTAYERTCLRHTGVTSRLTRVPTVAPSSGDLPTSRNTAVYTYARPDYFQANSADEQLCHKFWVLSYYAAEGGSYNRLLVGYDCDMHGCCKVSCRVQIYCDEWLAGRAGKWLRKT